MGAKDKIVEIKDKNVATEDKIRATLDHIVEIEWRMFQSVQNIGGRADCQDDHETFWVMRTSQLKMWPRGLQESYLCDLRSAEENHQNLITFKYAYMMERTAPAEFEAIRYRLPEVSEEKQKLIDSIVEQQLGQLDRVAKKYPGFILTARPLHRSADGDGCTSFETYLWGELKTYSERTLHIYADFLGEDSGKHMVEDIFAEIAGQYGYDSLADF